MQEILSQKVPQAERITKDKIHIDAELSIDRVDVPTHTLVHKLEPFGMKNQKPLFIFSHSVFHIRPFGKTQNHIELGFKNSRGRTIKATAFFREDLLERNLQAGDAVRFVATLEKEVYNNNHYISLRLHDIL